MNKKLNGLYVITDEKIYPGRRHSEIAEAALKGGAGIIQIRDKDASDRYFYEEALKIRNLCDKYNAIFIVNDRIHIAMAVNADGVNAGQRDLPCREIRRLLGKDKIIGISASDLNEAVEAEKEGADYIGFGPIFPTETKLDYECITGIETLQKVRDKVKIPIASIGGINQSNIEKIKDISDMICVVSCVVMSEDMEKTVSLLCDKCKK